MSQSLRAERIEKLLQQVRYEIERGVLNREIDEQLGFQFIVPMSREGEQFVVLFDLRMHPVHRSMAGADVGKFGVITGGKDK